MDKGQEKQGATLDNKVVKGFLFNMSTRLILIRHGSTQWNSEKRYLSFSNIGLNKKGQGEAKILYEKLKNEIIHRVYSSDAKRTIQTAQIIFRNLRIEQVQDLRELHFGSFEGLTYHQILKRYPLVYRKWLSNPYKVNIPKGENLSDFKKRIVGAFRKIILLNKNKTVAVVCHAGVISVFLNHLLKSKKFWKYIPNFCSLNIIEFTHRKGKVRVINNNRT